MLVGGFSCRYGTAWPVVTLVEFTCLSGSSLCRQLHIQTCWRKFPLAASTLHINPNYEQSEKLSFNITNKETASCRDAPSKEEVAGKNLYKGALGSTDSLPLYPHSTSMKDTMVVSPKHPHPTTSSRNQSHWYSHAGHGYYLGLPRRGNKRFRPIL